MTRGLFGCVAACCLLSAAAVHAAEEDFGEDRFTLSVGAYDVFRYDSIALLTSSEFGAGLALSPEDVLGLNSEQTVLRVEGTWNIRPAHALTFSWFDITSTNSLSVDTEFSWVDREGNEITIPVGASVESKLSYDILKVGYLWRFYTSDKVQLSAGAGLHMTDVKLSVEAETTVSDLNATTGETSVPLPVVSFALGYTVTPRFGWYLRAEVFALSFDDWSGTYNDALLGAEYRLWKNLGVGAALSSNSLRVLEEKAETRFEFNNRISGVLFFLRGHF